MDERKDKDMDIIKSVGTLFQKLPSQTLDMIDQAMFHTDPPDFQPADLSDGKEPYDIALAFGGLPERAEEAYKLYDQGKVRKILISGGVGELTPLYDPDPEPEANQYLKKFRGYEVPAEDILVDNESCNTAENVKNALALLKTKDYDLSTTSIVAISSEFHIFRCLHLLQKSLPTTRNLTWISVPSEYNGTWRTTSRGSFFVVMEYLKMLPYLPKS